MHTPPHDSWLPSDAFYTSFSKRVNPRVLFGGACLSGGSTQTPAFTTGWRPCNKELEQWTPAPWQRLGCNKLMIVDDS